MKNKLENLPFFYDRAIFIYRIFKTKDLKNIYLLFLIKLILKLFKKRTDFFDVNLLLNGIYDQYKLKKEKLNFDLQPLSYGLYLNYDSRRINENVKLYEKLLKIQEDNRSYQLQSSINILEHKLNGINKDWYKFKKKSNKLALVNYPIINKDELFLGPNWYEGIGHIALLGYLAKVYPNKFILLMVDGAKIANHKLLDSVKSKFKTLRCSPLIFNSFYVSQPNLIFSVDDTRLSGDNDPVSDFIYKGISSIEKNPYKIEPKISSLKTILNKDQIKNHNLFSEFVTLHVRSSPNEKNNSFKSNSRNSDINTYIEAIKFLLDNKINVVRIGDLDSPKLPYMNGFIDLTLNSRNTDNDIDLLANARFHIATSSGPINVPPLYGVPVLLTNSVRPLIQISFPMSFAISKKCLNKKTKKFMPYHSFLKSDFANEEMKRDFGEYMLIDNSSLEILYAVKKMFKLTSYGSIEKSKSEYEKIYFEYKKYLKLNALDNLISHMPVLSGFIKGINSNKYY